MCLMLPCARHNGQIIQGLSDQEVPLERLSSRFKDFGKASTDNLWWWEWNLVVSFPQVG